MNRWPGLDMLSFWIGAIVASIFWAILASLRPTLTAAIETLKKQQEEARLRASTGLEDSHRRIVYRQTQEMHIAASLFSLDEVVIEPRLLAPPAQIEPGMPPHHEDIVEQTIPYLPDWPALGAFYGAPSLGLAEALSGNANVVIIGQPGSGKTTALAYLASLIVNRQPEAASLHERTPFLLHVADLGLPISEPQKPEDLLTPIAEFIAARAPVLDIPRVPKFVLNTFQAGRALLLLDGLDELPPAQVQEASAYVRLLLRAYPQTRVLAAGAPEHIDGLLQLGFISLALLPWSRREQEAFLQKWDNLWQKYVKNETWAQTAPEVDNLLLKRWLSVDNVGLTPLEYTLKLWAGYAGDTRGPRPLDGIEAHLRRLTPASLPREALHILGTQTSLNSLAIFDNAQAREWLKSFEPAESAQAAAETAPAETPETAQASVDENNPEEEAAPVSAKSGKKDAKKPVTAPSLLQTLTSAGLLKTHARNRLRFSHPVLGAYLAGQGLRGPGAAEPILHQPAWSGRTQVMRYLAAFTDATPLIQSLLAEQDLPLQRSRLTAAQMLREAPRTAPWRNPLIANLIEFLQQEDLPLGLRGQALAALVLTNDPSLGLLFRQWLGSLSNELRLLAALGAGAIRDTKSVEGLANLLFESIGPAQRAACLALVAIGTPPALEAVATALLRGDEDLRRAAAEALANDPKEGREALREGISSDDILMRRAIVYGLARIPEDWATEILQKTQIEDTQWIVRNVATELLDSRARTNPRIPRRLSAPSETPWLVEFAGRQGMGISPGQPATDLLLQAFKGSNHDEQRAAIAYLRHTPSEGIVAELYRAYYGDKPELRELAYQTLCDYARGGFKLPPPMQFGLG
jgi:HEAT repeat protein/energy-coupling factor transporter ATP-binding protein EcfA2